MFSGGFDLKVMRSGPAAAGKLVTDGGELFTRMYGSPVPVVVACTGHAIAAGALLLLGADARIGARGEFRIGLIETSSAWCCRGGRSSSREERLSKRHFQDATVGARIYDPDGRGSTPASSTRSSQPEALAEAAARRGRSAGPSSRATRTAARSG